MKKTKILLTAMSASAFLALPQHAFSESILDITVSSEGLTYQESYSSVEDVMNGLDEDYIRQQLYTYTDQSEVFSSVNFKGIPLTLNFLEKSTELVLNIPSIGVSASFTGATRDDSVDQLEKWFKGDGGGALTILMQELAASTAHDPIAGNPNSLMGNMVKSDYDSSFTEPASNIKQTQTIKTGPSGGNSNHTEMQARYGSYRQGGMDNQHFSLPLSYTFRPNTSSKLKFKMPIIMTEVDGAKSYTLGFGMELGLQVTENWLLTPSINYSAVGSIDLYSAGPMASGALTSTYKIGIGDGEFSLGNMIGYYQTLEFSYDEYSFNPDIANTVTRNGLMLSIPTGNIMKYTALELFITDTRYFGSELYIDQYNEIGFSFGSVKNIKESSMVYLSDMKIGLTYSHAEDSEGFFLNFGYKF